MMKITFNLESSKKPKQEKGIYQSPLYFPSQQNDFNPDEVVTSFGQEKYDEMKNDSQVKSALFLKKLAIVGKGGDIVPPDGESDSEITEFVDFSTNDFMRGSFSRVLVKQLSALDYGFSVGEKIFETIDFGHWKGKIAVRQIKNRPPHSFEEGGLKTDEGGNLIEVVQTGETGPVTINRNKIILYSYNSDFDGDVYGKSDLRAAYVPWNNKTHTRKYWSILRETAATTPAMAFYRDGAGGTERQDIFNFLKKLQRKSIGVFPSGTEIEFPKSDNKMASDIYKDSMSYFDKSIARAILIPDLLGFTDSEFGSRALGTTQLEVFFNIINFLQEELAEEVVFDQYIRQLVDMNFGRQEHYPRYKFKPAQTEDKLKLIELFLEVAGKGMPITEKDQIHIREDLNFPKDELGVTIKPKAGPDPEEDEPDADKDDKDDDELQFALHDEVRMFRKPNTAEQRFEMDDVVDEIQNLETIGITKSEAIMSDIEGQIIRFVISKDVINKQDFDAINALDLTSAFKPLQKVMTTSAMDSFETGKKRAKVAIKNRPVELVSVGIGKEFTPTQTLKWLKQNGINIGTVLHHDVEDKVVRILLATLKKGGTTKDAVFEIEKMMQKYVKGRVTPTATIEPFRIRNVVRTNINNAYNMGIEDEFEKSEFVEAYQVSAILDDRTSPICIELDGEIYIKTNPNFTFPSYHNQCRTIVVAMFVGEDYVLSKKNPQQPTAKISIQDGFGKSGGKK